MHPNIAQMIIEISGYIFVVLGFAVSLYTFRKFTKLSEIRIGKKIVIPIHSEHFLKICCAFALLCLVVYVSYKHSGIECADLNEATRCQCYALEARHGDDFAERIGWATIGKDICPDSKYFNAFIAEEFKDLHALQRQPSLLDRLVAKLLRD